MCVHKGIVEIPVHFPVTVCIGAVNQLVYHTLDIPVIKIDIRRIVAAVILKVNDFLRRKAENKCISMPTSSTISTLAPSIVPRVGAPLSMNFMFPVPDASLEAVEICSLTSAAAKIISALDTL